MLLARPELPQALLLEDNFTEVRIRRCSERMQRVSSARTSTDNSLAADDFASVSPFSCLSKTVDFRPPRHAAVKHDYLVMMSRAPGLSPFLSMNKTFFLFRTICRLSSRLLVVVREFARELDDRPGVSPRSDRRQSKCRGCLTDGG